MALASYHTFYITDARNGHEIGFGLGLFIQMWHAQAGRYTSYAHLASEHREIPYIEPTLDGKSWQPMDAIYVPVEKFVEQAVPVKRGQVIGTVGHTGLLKQQELPRNPPRTEVWDETWDPAGAHLHVEVFTRTPDGSAKDKRFDPFGLKQEARAYNLVDACGLWLGDQDGRLLWASDTIE